MSDFRFLEPHWVHALWALVAVLGVLFWLERRGGEALDRLMASRLQERLVQKPSPSSRRVSLLLVGLACAFLVLALMRPQWGLHYVPAARVGAEIMVCLDVSKSMLAEDVAPSRLERAKAEIRDLLPFLDGDYVGLIAFAGRASVLAPLTPDFGFLRLVLEGVGTNSVTRGGTHLEEPIRKAVEGFAAAGDLSRAILLITDGEDHDSFPMDAATAAAEIGVKIIAIGLGDEAGSDVIVTDPRTGARTRLLDSDGRPVRTRLDGEMLRQIALATGGAYVPAGTGTLDLESIYRTHIAPLKRGALERRGKAVRYEGYQWAVLLGLISLVLSVGVAGHNVSTLPAPGGKATRKAVALLLLGMLFAAAMSQATSSARASESDTAPTQEGEVGQTPVPAPGAEATSGENQPEDPREVYNRGLGALNADQLEEAETDLETARSSAGNDGVLRYRATYNLGLTAARQADQLMASHPEDALKQLQRAADWFREAVRLRPAEEDPRHNLEVVLKRALVLRDALLKRDPGDWSGALEELSSQERALVAELRETLERVAAEPGPNGVEDMRRQFRGLAATQRTILSDADGLANRVWEERDTLQAKPEEERSPEDATRLVQLENLLHYLHRARERMGQARSQLRERQAERAYRRGSAALSELRRAQDQLRSPVQVLDGVIQEAVELASGTAILGASIASLPAATAPVDPPVWLTTDYLREGQQSLSERTSELHARLEAGLAADPGATPNPDIAELLALVREAEPLVARGKQAFERAHASLIEEDLPQANAAQVEAIRALLDARERFLDLRSLIEAAYADQLRIRSVLLPEEEESALPLAEMLPTLRELQTRNVDRGERLQRMIAAEQGRLGAGAETGPAEAIEAERLAAAEALLKRTREAMREVQTSLGRQDSESANPADLALATAAVAKATEGLAELRRLFFSIVQRLQDTARRQLELNDQTQDATALFSSSPESGTATLGPLIPRQEALARIAGELADALEEQSRQSVAQPLEDPNVAASTASSEAEQAQRLRRAGEFVLGAHDDMTQAADGMKPEPPEFERTREHQDTALAQLAQAIALLTEPPPQDSQQQESESCDQPNPSEQGGEKQTGPDPSQARVSDPAQLLQAVRDRAAQRQRERSKGERSGYESVEKDW
jgi:Ca-activated chloride channel family protein